MNDVKFGLFHGHHLSIVYYGLKYVTIACALAICLYDEVPYFNRMGELKFPQLLYLNELARPASSPRVFNSQTNRFQEGLAFQDYQP
jgi:hypothetical protein